MINMNDTFFTNGFFNLPVDVFPWPDQWNSNDFAVYCLLLSLANCGGVKVSYRRISDMLYINVKTVSAIIKSLLKYQMIEKDGSGFYTVLKRESSKTVRIPNHIFDSVLKNNGETKSLIVYCFLVSIGKDSTARKYKNKGHFLTARISQRKIGSACGLTPPTVATAINDLESKGMLTRIPTQRANTLTQEPYPKLNDSFVYGINIKYN